MTLLDHTNDEQRLLVPQSKSEIGPTEFGFGFGFANFIKVARMHERNNV